MNLKQIFKTTDIELRANGAEKWWYSKFVRNWLGERQSCHDSTENALHPNQFPVQMVFYEISWDIQGNL